MEHRQECYDRKLSWRGKHKNKQEYHPVRRVGKPQSQREPRAQREPCSQRETRAYSYAYAEYTVGTRP